MKFSIVIPTLDRADVLPWAINSCLNQLGNHEFEIVVSDNFSEDNTHATVESFADSRLVYTRTDRRLSMSGNWNHAYGHVTGDIVMYLGDDDILSPHAFNIANQLFDTENISAISRLTGYYYTPECQSPRAGFLVLPCIDGTYELRNSLAVLRRVAAFTEHYGQLPLLYHGFVKRNVLDRLLQHGLLFRKAAPDIFSDINIGSLGIDYAYVRYPLTLGVASPKSNGLNFESRSKLGEEFAASSIAEFQHSYPLDPIPLHVLDCLEEIHRATHAAWDIDHNNCYVESMKVATAQAVKAALPFLMKLSGKSPAEIWADWMIQRLRPRSLLKRVIGDSATFKLSCLRSGGWRSSSNSFFYFGDLRRRGILDPLKCLAFVEKKVRWTGRRVQTLAHSGAPKNQKGRREVAAS
ncbi:MAG: glycosyltransferase [Polyangia bacterium]